MTLTMGERIRLLREANSMTQEELGELIHVQKSAIRKYEKGEVENIKRSSVKIMAERFGVSPCYLMWGIQVTEKDKLATKSELEELNRLYDDLPDDTKKHILGIVRSLSEAHKEKVVHQEKE